MSDKNRLQQFRDKRAVLNEKILALDHLGVKRFFNLDTNTYRDGALDGRSTKPFLKVCTTCGATTSGLRRFCQACGSEALSTVV